MSNYYIADTHLGHANIIKLSHRPFNDVFEMDETIIKNWNNRVKPNDHIYILGDIVFRSKDPEKYLTRLNGIKHLIVGNHDSEILKHKYLKYFSSIDFLKTIVDGPYKIVLCHYPIAEWDGYFRGTYHFFGHIHNNVNETSEFMDTRNNAFNVGADILGFTPKTAKEIING